MKNSENQSNAFLYMTLGAIALLSIYLFLFLSRIDRITEFMVIWPIASLATAYRSYCDVRKESGAADQFFLSYLLPNLVLLLGFASILVAGFNLTKYTFDSLISAASSSSATAIAILTLIAGLILFRFRDIARQCYGLTEVIVGMSIAAYKIPLSTGIEETFIIALTGGLYLVVRGLDNIKQGQGSDSIIRILKPMLLKSLRKAL